MNRGLQGSLALCAGMALAVLGGTASGQTASAQSAPAQSSSGDSGSPASRTIRMVQAQAELSTTLDAKKAKQGEAVKAKLANDVKIPNAQMLPRNTVLEGHVDQVQPSDHRSDSTLVVTFDKALLKGGKELPIKATVVSVSEPINQFQQQQEQQAGPPSNAGMSGPGGATQSAGGPGAGSPGAMPNTPAPTPEEGGAGAVQQAGRQSGKNGIPGVMLTSDIHQHTSATFTARGQNVKVPSGTEMQVALAIIPPGVNIQ